ncbi:hybrid sensor histidine kinase/response regulator [Nitratireductor sp. GCM10026969]|uniref:hybrid sensor histidine kinase/response regulator n=1 Tax=Nitratireductor sp. GCM10026969 TaxID=3252645 RepID=UPI0036166003
MKSEKPAASDAIARRLNTPEQFAAVYAAVVASALDAVIVVDEEGVVVTMNPAAEEIFGYRLSEATGRKIGDLIVPDHLKCAHEAGVLRYRATREPHVLGRRVEMEAQCSDGRIIPVELAITEVALPEGNLFTANLRDLSSARAASAEIERQREALYQNERLAAVGSLLAGVAHELNNPLSIVLGQSTLLREEIEATGTSLLERATKIEAAAERCVRIVRSFLAMARQRKAEMRSVEVVPLIEGAIELLGYGLRSAGIEIVREFAPALPKVVADPDQVQNILTNLLVNAMQALESIHGYRKIRVGATYGNGGLQILVADNGPGVAPDHARRIFDPFFTTKPQGVGTGIGLSISRGLAEAQGGKLEMVDNPGIGGAAFELVLPTIAKQPGGAGVSGVATDRSTPTQVAECPLAIVIDDEPEVAVLLADALGKAGYRCDVATSGREGQALIAAQPAAYDVIICDLRMPDIDGPALFRWLRAHHPLLAKRIVFATGDALGPAAGRFLSEAGCPVLEKPFTAAEVAAVVETPPASARNARAVSPGSSE